MEQEELKPFSNKTSREEHIAWRDRVWKEHNRVLKESKKKVFYLDLFKKRKRPPGIFINIERPLNKKTNEKCCWVFSTSDDPIAMYDVELKNIKSLKDGDMILCMADKPKGKEKITPTQGISFVTKSSIIFKNLNPFWLRNIRTGHYGYLHYNFFCVFLEPRIDFHDFWRRDNIKRMFLCSEFPQRQATEGVKK